MICESYHYKHSLLSFADSLERWHQTRRWSDKRCCDYERNVFTSFFFIRKLAESHKLSDAISKQDVPLSVYSPTGKNVTIINCHRIDKLYNLDNPSSGKRSLAFVSNQVIHSHVFCLLINDGGASSSIFFSSDRDRNKNAYEIKDDILCDLLRSAGNDYPDQASARFNPEKRDFDVRLSGGIPKQRVGSGR